VSTADVVTTVIGGVVALALLVYLFVALLRPERF
jgi:K+-transporting ATPase KdpF subunit